MVLEVCLVSVYIWWWIRINVFLFIIICGRRRNINSIWKLKLLRVRVCTNHLPIMLARSIFLCITNKTSTTTTKCSKNNKRVQKFTPRALLKNPDKEFWKGNFAKYNIAINGAIFSSTSTIIYNKYLYYGNARSTYRRWYSNSLASYSGPPHHEVRECRNP